MLSNLNNNNLNTQNLDINNLNIVSNLDGQNYIGNNSNINNNLYINKLITNECTIKDIYMNNAILNNFNNNIANINVLSISTCSIETSSLNDNIINNLVSSNNSTFQLVSAMSPLYISCNLSIPSFLNLLINNNYNTTNLITNNLYAYNFITSSQITDTINIKLMKGLVNVSGVTIIEHATCNSLLCHNLNTLPSLIGLNSNNLFNLNLQISTNSNINNININNDCYIDNLIVNKLELTNNNLSNYNLSNYNFENLLSEQLSINNLNLNKIDSNLNLINNLNNSTGIFYNNVFTKDLNSNNISSNIFSQNKPIVFMGQIKSQTENFVYNIDDIIHYDNLIDPYNCWNNNTYQYSIFYTGIYSIHTTFTSADYDNLLNLKLIQSRNGDIINSVNLGIAQINSSVEGFNILNCLANDLIWIACNNNNASIYNDNTYGAICIELC